jgi:hypothetical protein
MIFFLVLVDYPGVSDAGEKVTLLAANTGAMYGIMFVAYILFGVLLVVLSLALRQRLRNQAPALVDVATVFGIIWATILIAAGMIFNVGMHAVVEMVAANPDRAQAVWTVVELVHDGIGGGSEIVGGVWILLLSIAALRVSPPENGASDEGTVLVRPLPRALNYLGIVIGAAGILSDIPGLGETLGIVFGLLQIVWFFWVGSRLIGRAG